MNPILARIYFIPKDPAVIITLILSVLGLQFLLWIIARYSADIEWWRSGMLGFLVAVIGPLAIGMISTQWELATGLLIGLAFIVWILCGLLYDLEIWQRIVVALASPIIGSGAFLLALLIRRWIFGW